LPTINIFKKKFHYCFVQVYFFACGSSADCNISVFFRSVYTFCYLLTYLLKSANAARIWTIWTLEWFTAARRLCLSFAVASRQMTNLFMLQYRRCPDTPKKSGSGFRHPSIVVYLMTCNWSSVSTSTLQKLAADHACVLIGWRW